tara:strand:+ start:272 stop:523 length:252 start_codon:yes stop_codon:yes gene_type:complete
MDPLSATVDFVDYFNAKYSDRATVKPEEKTFTKSELQTMNYGSLWRGCIVLPKSSTDTGTYTVEPTGEINGSMDIYKAIPKPL